jgi:hypothetical protein
MARRRLGERAAQNRYRALLAGREISPEKQALLRISCLLVVHLENISGRLFADGELTQAGDAKQALGRLIELAREVTGNLETVFPGTGADDPIAALLGGRRGD